LQHADNPVDWYPWGEEALQLAKRRNAPILLGIGYAACHWCHVMAHESFEDPATAEMMNGHFVNIKVDREERPDLDSIYMNAVVAITGRGGWPLTVFLTPACEPFFGGTYFPNQPRYGMPSFQQVLAAVSDAWETRKDEVLRTASELTQGLSQRLAGQGQPQAPKPALLAAAAQHLSSAFDARNGGFGGAPKFPQPMIIEFLLQYHLRTGDQHAVQMAEFTLRKMAYGGIYDQVGGGFARYSVDDAWLVPHFEKMLYDNAQLARVYLHAWQITGNPLLRRIVEEMLDYVLREMQHADGGFYSSQDADSEGVEGKFYVWTLDEMKAALGGAADLLSKYYGLTEQGNWEGKNILHVPQEPDAFASRVGMSAEKLAAAIADAKRTLYRVRAQRVWPGLDDKVLTSWNGLMLAALAEAGSALQRTDYLAAAQRNAEFLHRTMRADDGRLYRTWKAGASAKHNAYLEDYAFLAEGLLALYQSTFELRWFTWARELVELMLRLFYDDRDKNFFDTSYDHERLIKRPKDLQDSALPSGNAVAVAALLKLSLLTGNSRCWDVASEAVASMTTAMGRAPQGFGCWLSDAAFLLSEPTEIGMVGDPADADTQSLLEVVRAAYRPYAVVAVGEGPAGEVVPLLSGRLRTAGRATAFVCHHSVCRAPVTDPEQLEAELNVAA